MKIKPILTALTLLLMLSCANNDGVKNPATLKKPVNDEDKFSYSIGYDIGNSFLKSLVDDSININLDYIY